MASTDANNMDRSRSPQLEEGPSYRKWTNSFDNWATNNLDEMPDDTEMFNMYRRGLRIKNFYLVELLENKLVDSPSAGSIRFWALEEARKEIRKDACAAQTKVKQQKEKKAHKDEEVVAEPQKKKRRKEKVCEKGSEKEEKNVEKEAAADDLELGHKKSEPELALARPCASTLDTELAQVQETISNLTEKEDAAILKQQQLEKSKKDMIKDKAGLDKLVQRLSSSAVKKNPAVQLQIQTSKTKIDKLVSDTAKVDVQIVKAKESTKQIRADVKKHEKQEAAFKLLISKECAETPAEDEPDAKSEEGPSAAEKVFEILDRTSSGTVNKRDFIKGLANDLVSSFFALPPKIRQEDGSRDDMERVFQKLAQGGEEFDLAALIAHGSADSNA